MKIVFLPLGLVEKRDSAENDKAVVVVGGGNGAVNVVVDAEVAVVLVGNGAIGFEATPILIALTGEVD